jgi:hypothetical protein
MAGDRTAARVPALAPDFARSVAAYPHKMIGISFPGLTAHDLMGAS